MELEAICRDCGRTVLVGALVAMFALPANICEKCQHEHAPHAQESSYIYFSEPIAVSGAISSTMAILPPAA